MRYKLCSTCAENKPFGSYYKHHRRGLQAQCILCKKEYNKNHYKKDSAKYKTRAAKLNQEYKEEVQSYLISYLKEHTCVRCPETDIVVLDFDHINPEGKEFSISAGIRSKLKIGRIKVEIEKCQVLCANCHRRKTAKDNNWYKL